MGFEHIRKMPSPEDIIAEIPRSIKKPRRQLLCQILKYNSIFHIFIVYTIYKSA